MDLRCGGAAVPDGFGSSAERHDEVRPGEAGAAAGSSGAVMQAGGLGRQRADVTEVTRGHGAAACAARRDVAVQHLAVHHWLLVLLITSKDGSDVDFHREMKYIYTSYQSFFFKSL